jgi:hypothetical protein
MLEERLQGPPNPSILRVLEAIREIKGKRPDNNAILLAHARHQLDLLLAEAVNAVTTEDLYEAYCTPIQWLRYEGHLASGVAAGISLVGTAIDRLPKAVAAVEAGEIGFSHLALLAEAQGRLGDVFDEERLLSAARTQTVTEFRKTVEHTLHACDPARFAAEEAKAREHRQLKLSPLEDGSMFLKGWLEAEGASVVRAALEPLAKPAGAGDDRRREQRLGDALVELAGQGVKTELVVSVPLETMLAVKGAPAAETEWGGVVSSEVVRRLLCDADVRRLVLDPEGEVVDFGRRRRLFSPKQRKAMAARDGHCVFPGCDRPPRWCDGHHRRAVAEGGGTDLENGWLLCKRHHTFCHDGWKLVRDGPRIRAIPPARMLLKQWAPGLPFSRVVEKP